MHRGDWAVTPDSRFRLAARREVEDVASPAAWKFEVTARGNDTDQQRTSDRAQGHPRRSRLKATSRRDLQTVAKRRGAARGTLARFRGRATVRLGTEEIMALTRGSHRLVTS